MKPSFRDYQSLSFFPQKFALRILTSKATQIKKEEDPPHLFILLSIFINTVYHMLLASTHTPLRSTVNLLNHSILKRMN